MSQYVLQNDVYLPEGLVKAGKIVDDTVVDIARLRSARAVLVPLDAMSQSFSDSAAILSARGNPTAKDAAQASADFSNPAVAVPIVNVDVALVTADGAAHVAYTDALPDNSMSDYAIVVMGQRTDVLNGDAYRAELYFTYQRFNGGAAALVGSAPTAANARSNGGGAGYAVSVGTVGTAGVTVSVQGAGGVSVKWQVVGTICRRA